MFKALSPCLLCHKGCEGGQTLPAAAAHADLATGVVASGHPLLFPWKKTLTTWPSDMSVGWRIAAGLTQRQPPLAKGTQCRAGQQGIAQRSLQHAHLTHEFGGKGNREVREQHVG